MQIVFFATAASYNGVHNFTGAERAAACRLVR
jgi:hypothetical protein